MIDVTQRNKFHEITRQIIKKKKQQKATIAILTKCSMFTNKGSETRRVLSRWLKISITCQINQISTSYNLLKNFHPFQLVKEIQR